MQIKADIACEIGVNLRSSAVRYSLKDQKKLKRLLIMVYVFIDTIFILLWNTLIWPPQKVQFMPCARVMMPHATTFMKNG